MSKSHAATYADLRVRVSDVIRQTDDAALSRPAPATPGWTAHDVVSHLVGVPDDVVNGRLEGIASDPWTEAQVFKRVELSTAELLAEWEETSPAFEALLADSPAEIAGQAIFDAATHEHDLRHALGTPGDRDGEAIALSWEWITDARTRGVHALCFVIDGNEQVSGTGDIVARIEAPRFELFRAVSGRRTAEEISQYKWDREPEPSLLIAATFFSMREESLRE